MAETTISPAKSTDSQLLVTLRAQPGWLTVALLAGLLSAAGQLLLPGTLGRGLDAALTGGSGLLVALAALVVIIVVVTAADVLAQIAGTAGVAGTTAWVRHRVLRRLLGLGMRGRHAYPAGDAVTRLTAGAAAAGRVVPLVITAATTAVTALVALVLLGMLDWTLPLTLVAGLGVSLLLLRPFTGQATTAFEDYQASQGAIANRLVDALSGLRTIRAAGTTEREVERVLHPLPELRAAGARTWVLQRRLAWSFGLLIRLLQLAVLATGGWALTEGRITPGELIAAVAYAGVALQAVEQIDMFVELVQVRAGAARVRPLLDEPPRKLPSHRRYEGPGDVTIWDATVHLDGNVVLDKCTVNMPSGATTAVVGPSGSGKSVLVGLIGGIYHPDDGHVLVDGCPIGGLTDADRSRAVAYAFERPVLVGGDLGNAIGYGMPTVPSDQRSIEEAARAALVDDVVCRLPDGYRTDVTDVPLSGGERQRLGLARAVAQRPSVLVLDDATSSLDTATEMEFQHALDRMLPGRTRVVVTHRARTASYADQVVWMDRGRIRGVGRHAELWRDRDYRALFSAAEVTAS